MIWLILFLSLQTHAKTVLLRGPQTSAVEYQAMLKAHSALISPVQLYLESRPLAANREHLLALFSEAQRDFLNKSNEEATAKFTSVAEMLTLDDWEQSDREIFLHSLLRLAQLTENPDQRDDWLKRSLSLEDAAISSDLIPPPLLTRRAELEKQIPKSDAIEKLRANGWNEVLLNGLRCGTTACQMASAIPGKTRLTLLSEQFTPSTQVIESRELSKFNPAGERWAVGRCGNSTLSQAAKDLGSVKIFWGLKCDGDASTTVAGGKLKTVEAPLPLFTTASPKPIQIYRSPWFWAGVGAAVVAIIVATAPKKETREPTTTYGN